MATDAELTATLEDAGPDTDDDPLPHVMEAGTPHAPWALVERTDAGWRTEARATPYDTAAAVAAGWAHDRPDWADWIASGRAAR